MTAQLIIPIETNPRLTQHELDAFIAQAHKLGRDPNEMLTELLVEAIRLNEQKEAQAVTPAMAA